MLSYHMSVNTEQLRRKQCGSKQHFPQRGDLEDENARFTMAWLLIGRRKSPRDGPYIGANYRSINMSLLGVSPGVLLRKRLECNWKQSAFSFLAVYRVLSTHSTAGAEVFADIDS